MLFLTPALGTWDRLTSTAEESLKRPRELETLDQRHWRTHARERRVALRDAPEGGRGNLFEDSFAVLADPDAPTFASASSRPPPMRAGAKQNSSHATNGHAASQQAAKGRGARRQEVFNVEDEDDDPIVPIAKLRPAERGQRALSTSSHDAPAAARDDASTSSRPGGGHHPTLGERKPTQNAAGYAVMPPSTTSTKAAVGTRRASVQQQQQTRHGASGAPDSLAFGAQPRRAAPAARRGRLCAAAAAVGMGSPAATLDLGASTRTSTRAGAAPVFEFVDDDDDDDSGRPSASTTVRLSRASGGYHYPAAGAGLPGTHGTDEAARKAAVREQQLQLLEGAAQQRRFGGGAVDGQNLRRRGHSVDDMRGRAAAPAGGRRLAERDASADDDVVDGRATDDAVQRRLRSTSADLVPYRRALSSAVASTVATAVAGHVGRLIGATKASIAERIRGIAAAKCPRPKGVLKAIKSQRPHAIPIDLDAADADAVAQLRRRGREDLVINRLDFNIRAYQLRSLEGTAWVNDQVINLYCAMVASCFPDRVATLGSFLHTKLAAGEDPAASRREALRWTLDKDVFAVPKVLIVVNDGVHWTLAVLNNAAGRVEYYDSLGGAGDRPLDRLVAFFDAEYAVKRDALAAKAARDALERARKPVPEMKKKEERRMLLKAATPLPRAGRPSGWPRFQPRKHVPQQNNGYDCGVFCSQFALCSALDVSPSAVAQADMAFLRSLMTLELIQGQFLHRF